MPPGNAGLRPALLEFARETPTVRNVRRRHVPGAGLRFGDYPIQTRSWLSAAPTSANTAKGKKATTVKHAVWQIRADSIRNLNRTEKEPETLLPASLTGMNHTPRDRKTHRSSLLYSSGERNVLVSAGSSVEEQ